MQFEDDKLFRAIHSVIIRTEADLAPSYFKFLLINTGIRKVLLIPSIRVVILLSNLTPLFL